MQLPLRPALKILLAAFFSLLTSLPAADRELIIASPHWEGVQYEFGRAFEEYYRAKTGQTVRVRWRDLGGTTQIEKALDASYKATPDSCQIDVFFGGGFDPFENQKRKGRLIPCKLPDEVLQKIAPSMMGMPIIDPDYMFYGAALSSFGLVENVRVMERLHLPPVNSWEDLGQPELYGWVSSSDPRKSGSVHMIYEIILQAYGWEKGWEVIYTSSGNVRSFLQSSSAPTKEVSVGDAAVAISIDINGLTQQAFLGKENVTFKIPTGVSVINPDGLAILKGAPNLEVAREFVYFVMSEAGQGLWMKPQGTPGGAVRYGITRMGVWPSLYPADLSQLLVPVNPFQIKAGFDFKNEISGGRWNVLNALIGQTVIDVHTHLRRAWKTILELPANERPRWQAELCQPFITFPEVLELEKFWRKDKVRSTRLSNTWMQQAVQRYDTLIDKIHAEAKNKPAVTALHP
jgi:ABC-type Fe3+ transport system substrate-binding protein